MRQPLQFKGQLPGLDVLRGVAIFMVCIYHGIGGTAPFQEFVGIQRSFVHLTLWGSAGVHLFYVLSGFLITGILVDGERRPGFYSTFYLRRACRILPAYFLVLAILKATNMIGWPFVLAAVLFIANMAGLTGARTSEYGPLWSLAVEEQFYLVWPWVVRRFSLKLLAPVVGATCIAILIVMVWVAHHAPRVDIKYKLWSNAPWLLAGALIAITLRSGVLNRGNIRRWVAVIGVVALVLLPIIPWVDSGVAPNSAATALYRLPFVLVFVVALLKVIERNRGEMARPPILSRIFAFLGYLSYGLYLIHEMIFVAYDKLLYADVDHSNHDIRSLLIRYVVCFSVSVMLAYVSRRYFEEFFLRFGRTPNQRHPKLDLQGAD